MLAGASDQGTSLITEAKTPALGKSRDSQICNT
jgi:hypothetical protein